MKSIQNFESFVLNNEQEAQTIGGLSGRMERLLRRRRINRRKRLEALEASAVIAEATQALGNINFQDYVGQISEIEMPAQVTNFIEECECGVEDWFMA